MNFIHEDFLLDTPAARELYHGYAEGLPIIDYHSHLNPREIATDRRWDNLAQIWLLGDHYKWRAMRTAGVAERFCTGDATDWEKFEQYAGAMPKFLRNPLYHWSHLELARYFGVNDRLLDAGTAREIYDRAGAVITSPGFSCRSLMRQSGVEVVCTTDDPVDTLEDHRALAADPSFGILVLPTWRPDLAWAVDRPRRFLPWLARLEAAANRSLSTLGDLLQALRARHDFFAECGCRLSDRGLDTLAGGECTETGAQEIFMRARSGQPVSSADAGAFQAYMLHELAVMDAEKGWTLQIHFGALRANNTRMFNAIGPDTGFDSIGDSPVAAALAAHLDRLDRIGRLPKTILYNLNPRDNELFASMIGNFQDGVTPGKMQFGSGWWFLDQLDGMTRQIEALSQLGLLSQFVGMLTDSRSFISFTRHEYFRRLLCNILGEDIRRGRLPSDLPLVGAMVRDISYRNAKNFFGFKPPAFPA